MPNALHFGAGNIGRGFIGPLLADSGYHVTFADINEDIIDSLNTQDEYTVHILSRARHSSTSSVTSFSGVISTSPDLIDEFPHIDLITTSVGAQILPRIAPSIAKGLKRVHSERPSAVIDIIACENGVGASEMLKSEVERRFNEDATPEQRRFLEEQVGFANCSVDRIVPPFDPMSVASSEEEKEARKLDVGVEDFYEWVVDEDALKMDHQINGMRLAKDLLAYVERKLFTLNTAHATISYLGYMKGYKMVDEAIEDPQIYEIVKKVLEEAGAALLKKHSSFTQEEHKKYVETILEGRLKNPNVKDEITRVSRCPKRKLGRNDRLVGPAMMTYEFGVSKPTYLSKAIAAALWYDEASDEDAQEVRELIQDKGLESAFRHYSGLFKGDEAADQLVESVLEAYATLKSELGVELPN